MSNRIEIGSDPAELAKTLRGFAETTARFSQNWDNYEAILLDVLTQIKEHVEKGSNK